MKPVTREQYDEFMRVMKIAREAADLLKCKPEDIVESIEKLLLSIEETKEELDRLRRKLGKL